jgi:hypothetical protein
MAVGKKLDELNRLYDKAEDADREIFAEMRSNILLVSGEHYSKVNARIASNLRTSSKTTAASEQKLRLTKNHMHRASRSYVTAILSEAPDTTVKPQRPTELQDKKDAELNLSVWQDIKSRHEVKEKKADWCKNFVDLGEVCTKIWWNPNKGEFKGYEPLLDEETGEPVLEETGEMQAAVDQATGQPLVDPATGQPILEPVLRQVDDEGKPTFSGDFDFEDVFGFNLLREAAAQTMYEHGRAWIVRKMVDTEDLKRQFKDDPDVVEKIHDSQHETYVVFDANKGTYDKVKGQVLVREFYWPKCEEYPKGWYVYATKDVKLAEGELPGGIWPLVWAGFDKYATTPRGRSILKVARPYQAEINRASSQMAVAQVTLGDDKVLYQSGTKLAPGALLPGVRGISYQGQRPEVLPGRNGAQYLEYVNSQINEMDRALMLEDNEVLDKSGQMDPYALLFRAAARKRKYGPYIEKFESFLVRVTKTCLELAKFYLPDDMLVPAVGTREAVNIEEFRKTTPLNYQITIEPMAETLETQFGRQLTFQHILQYVGKDLDKRTIGKVVKNLPFANFEDSFDDLTIDDDIAENDMLALERGQPAQATKYVDADFMLKKLTSRMKKPEYQFLPDQIKQNYEALKQQYEMILAEQQAKLLAAKNEFIPVDGALVTVDMYVADQSNPNNQAKRAKLPQRAVEWLIKALEAQGMSLDKLEGMNATAMAEMAEMLMSKRGQAQIGVDAGMGMPQMAG